MTTPGNAWRTTEDNFLGLEEPWCRADTAGVIVLPAPFEATSSYGAGSAAGPEAIIVASREVELFDAELGVQPYEACRGVVTLPPLDPHGHTGETYARALETAVASWLEAGRFVVTLGGEHTATVGAALAHCAAFDELTVLHLDAHSDLRPDYLADPWSHACAAARILDRHDHVVQVGIRSQDADERRTAIERELPVYYAHRIHDATEAGDDWAGAVAASCRRRVYLTFDCDVFDPAIIPATGTPEPGGLTWRQANTLIDRICAERELVGLDLCELAPVPGLHHPQFTIARFLSRLLGRRFG